MNTRMGVRISPELRESMEQTIKEGKYKNFSDLIREAVKKLLESERKKGKNNPKKQRGYGGQPQAETPKAPDSTPHNGGEPNNE